MRSKKKKPVDLQTGLVVNKKTNTHRPTIYHIDNRYVTSNQESFSVRAKFTIVSASAADETVFGGLSGYFPFSILYSDTIIRVTVGGGGVVYEVNGSTVGNTFDVVVIYRAAYITFFVNGMLIAQNYYASEFATDTTYPIELGHLPQEMYNPTKYAGHSIIHSLVFFNKDIYYLNGIYDTSAIEVMNRTGNYIPPVLHPYVVGHWACQEKEGNRLYDCVDQYNYAKNIVHIEKGYHFKNYDKWYHDDVINDTDDVTVEMLVACSKLPTGYDSFFMRGKDGLGGWSIRFYCTANKQFGAAVVRNNTEIGGTFVNGGDLNKVYHLALTVNRSTGELLWYTNGVLSAQSFFTTNIDFRNSTYGININDFGASDGDTLISNLRIWDKVRTASEIKNNMLAILPNQANLKMNIPFNEGSGSVAKNTVTNTAGNITGTAGKWDSILGQLTANHADLIGYTSDELKVNGTARKDVVATQMGRPLNLATFNHPSIYHYKVEGLSDLPTGNRTVSFYFYTEKPNYHGNIFGYGRHYGENIFDVFCNSGQINIHRYGDCGCELSNTANQINPSQLYFVSLVLTNTGTDRYDIQLYFDGALINTINLPINTIVDGTVLVGAGCYPQINHWNFSVGEIQIWDIARTQAQLKSDMYGIQDPTSEPNLKAYLKQAGNTLTEASGKSCTISTIGSPTAKIINPPVKQTAKPFLPVFNGVDQYVDTTAYTTPLDGSFTMEFDYTPFKAGDGIRRTLAGSGYYDSHNAGIMHSESNIIMASVTFPGIDYFLHSPNTLKVKVKYHIAIRWDFQTKLFELLIDGIVVASTVIANNSNRRSGGTIMLMGKGYGESTLTTDGIISNYRVWEVVRTDVEIKAGIGQILQPQTNLKLQWTNNEVTGTTIADSSGNGYTGTRYGSTEIKTVEAKTGLPAIKEGLKSIIRSGTSTNLTCSVVNSNPAYLLFQDAFTVSLGIFVNSFSASSILFRFEGTDWILYSNGTNIEWRVGLGGEILQIPHSNITGFYAITLTRSKDRKTVTLMVNNKQVTMNNYDENSSVAGWQTNTTGITHGYGDFQLDGYFFVAFGNRNESTYREHLGFMQNLRYSNYHQPNNCVYYWQYNQIDTTAGNKIMDLSGNNNHGTLQGYSTNELDPTKSEYAIKPLDMIKQKLPLVNLPNGIVHFIHADHGIKLSSNNSIEYIKDSIFDTTVLHQKKWVGAGASLPIFEPTAFNGKAAIKFTADPGDNSSRLLREGGFLNLGNNYTFFELCDLTDAKQVTLGHGAFNDGGYMLAGDSGSQYHSPSGAYVSFASPIAENQGIRIRCIKRSGANIEYLLDNVSKGVITNGNSGADLSVSSIGAFSRGNSGVTGLIRIQLIFNRELNATEMQNVYDYLLTQK
jgi:hypothetical protein